MNVELPLLLFIDKIMYPCLYKERKKEICTVLSKISEFALLAELYPAYLFLQNYRVGRNGF